MRNLYRYTRIYTNGAEPELIVGVLTELTRKNGGIMRTADALKAGVSRTSLSKLERAGLLERVARGQYILPDSFPDELYIWQRRMNLLVYSHETALFLHGMAERTPAKHSVTFPSNARLSATFPGDIKVYFVKPESHELGAVFLPSMMGHEVRAYDVERTVCDVVRSRNRIDDQTFIAAIKNYAAMKNHDFNRLGKYAEVFRITKILRKYLEVLL
ncbi:MAG: type IV toxin-antitoxin system AbiEi family antitoxin domain-containing protein [Synergistaceae bacterium]|jgi:predicted transcriptional regulator of viral defense system|nr:type IV toxin-antitoxin system AbiEi family antitoxin domain-containing protein [Synergistaceae bacterium]